MQLELPVLNKLLPDQRPQVKWTHGLHWNRPTAFVLYLTLAQRSDATAWAPDRSQPPGCLEARLLRGLLPRIAIGDTWGGLCCVEGAAATQFQQSSWRGPVALAQGAPRLR